CGDGTHGHRPATPVGASIQVLPDVLGLERIAADDAGDHVIAQIARDRQLAAIKSAVAQAVDAFIGLDFERYKISSWRADQHLRVLNLHFLTLRLLIGFTSVIRRASARVTPAQCERMLGLRRHRSQTTLCLRWRFDRNSPYSSNTRKTA